MAQYGEKAVVALLIGLTGFITGMLLFSGGAPAEVIGLAGISGLGALLGGAAFGGFFGRQSKYAVGWAVLGAVLCTASGAGVGGLLLGGAEGLIVAPAMVFFGLFVQPIVGLCWVAMMIGVHLVAARQRFAVA